MLLVKTKELSYYAFITVVSVQLGSWLKTIGRDAEWVRERLIQEMDRYALTLDANLQKLVNEFGEYQGQVHSLLITFGHVLLQMIHIDMKFPNYQSVFYLSAGPVTHVFPAHRQLGLMTAEGVSPEQYVDWMMLELFDYEEGREALVAAIKSLPGVEQLIRDYGILGAPMSVLKSSEHKFQGHPVSGCQDGFFKGYCGFVGGWPHCGPSSDGFRAVMFSSYSPKGSEAYDATFQINPSTLVTSVKDTIQGVLQRQGAGVALKALNAWFLARTAADRCSHVRLGNYRLTDKGEKNWDKSDVSIFAAHALTTTFNTEASKLIPSKAKFVENMKKKLPGLPTPNQFGEYCAVLNQEKELKSKANQKKSEKRKRQS
jgi:hypothetical protein